MLSYSPDLTTHSDLDRVVFDVDVNKFSQVIRNLVSNAIKFTKKDGRILVSANYHIEKEFADGSSDGVFEVLVEDSGFGMSMV